MSSSNGTYPSGVTPFEIIFHASTSTERRLRNAYLFNIGGAITWIILFPIVYLATSALIWKLCPRRLAPYYQALWFPCLYFIGTPLWLFGWAWLDIFMRTGLTVFGGYITLVPELLPNDCEAAKQLEGSHENWPCFVQEWQNSVPFRGLVIALLATVVIPVGLIFCFTCRDVYREQRKIAGEEEKGDEETGEKKTDEEAEVKSAFPYDEDLLVGMLCNVCLTSHCH